jgi:hypothetical protein
MIWVRCVFLTMFLVGTACAQEVIVYGAGGSRRGSESFLERAGQIDVIAPQSYGVDSLGNVSGAVPQRLIDEALATGTRLMPLIMNPGFNQAQIHGLLANPDGRRRTVEFMVKEGIERPLQSLSFLRMMRPRRKGFLAICRITGGAILIWPLLPRSAILYP